MNKKLTHDEKKGTKQHCFHRDIKIFWNCKQTQWRIIDTGNTSLI